MKLTRWSSLCCAVLMLGGCSTISEWIHGKNNPATMPVKLADFSQTAQFKVRWHADLGDSGASVLQPAISKDAVFGVSGKGGLSRLERNTGALAWRIESGIRVSGGVGAGEGIVVVGGDKGDVLAYSEDGKLRWKSKVSSEVLSTPQIAEGVVVVRSGDGRITGLNVNDGKRAWVYERSTPALVVRSHAGVVIQRNMVFAGFAGGKLAAISIKDGSVQWENSVSQPRGNTELERISDITSDPVVDDEQVCAIAFQGRVACFDVAQGSPLWTRDIASDKGMMLLRKFLYLTDVNGVLMALEKSSGNTLWKNDQLSFRKNTSPYSVGNFTLTGDFEGHLHALNREDGQFVARIKLDDTAILGAPMALDDGLLVQTQGGGLYSLSLH
jgi:outer membrane protein assembly factor BamB